MSRVCIAELVVVCLVGHSQALRAQPVSAGFKAGATARLPAAPVLSGRTLRGIPAGGRGA